MKKLNEQELLTEYYDEIVSIMDTIKVGIFITDGQGNVLMVNKESERTGGLPLKDVIGKNMEQLLAEGYMDESSVLKALETKAECRMIQNLGDGGSIYLTAVPYYRGKEIALVVCTERDITETRALEHLLAESKEISEKQKRELEYLRTKTNQRVPHIIAESKKMKEVMQAAKRIAQLDTTVLILGESGVGKEVIADYIFRMSRRSEEPFIKINCAAIPENLLESELFGYEKGAFTGADTKGKIGIFEMAQEGTLFLDEIAEIPLRLQAKLLRVLQEKEIRRLGGKSTISVDVRIIAATNVNLKQAVEEGRFREDLYYRLSIVPIEIPPLRNRKEDIKAFAAYFLQLLCEDYNIKKNISDEAMEELTRAPWHGNIRELRNMMERIIVSYDGEQITKRQVRNLIQAGSRNSSALMVDENMTLEKLMAEYERELLMCYIEKYNTAAEAARKLGVNKSTVSRKLKKYNILQK